MYEPSARRMRISDIAQPRRRMIGTFSHPFERSSGWIRSSTGVPISSDDGMPSSDADDGDTYSKRPSRSTRMITSAAVSASRRNRDSLARSA